MALSVKSGDRRRNEMRRNKAQVGGGREGPRILQMLFRVRPEQTLVVIEAWVGDTS